MKSTTMNEAYGFNSYEAMTLRADKINDKTIKGIVKDCINDVGGVNKNMLKLYYDLSRLQAVNAGKWDNTKYSGFGVCAYEVFGVSESQASRFALVGRVFCKLGEDGKPTYGRYAGYNYTALMNMATTLKVEDSGVVDVEKTLERIDKFIFDAGITSKTPKSEIIEWLKDTPEYKSKPDKRKKSKGKDTAATNNNASDSKKSIAVEIPETNDIADFGKIATTLAKELTAEQLPLLTALIRRYENAVGVTIKGCESDALKKLVKEPTCTGASQPADKPKRTRTKKSAPADKSKNTPADGEKTA